MYCILINTIKTITVVGFAQNKVFNNLVCTRFFSLVFFYCVDFLKTSGSTAQEALKGF